MSEMRLQKWLSQLGIASRREAEKWISDRRLAVNGKVISELGTKVNPESDTIALDGKILKTKVPPKVYWLLNKPDKILTARSDELTNKPTIYDLPMVSKAKFLVSPVGRLDFRTEGLLLLTNDGDLNYKLCRPEYHVPREYQVLLDSRLTKEQEQEVKKGITLEDGPVVDVKITYVHGTNMGVSTGSWYVVTVHEGRNRLVRRLFEYFSKRVVRLIRVGFGDIRLPQDLPAGEYRQLTPDQVVSLKNSTETTKGQKPEHKISRSKARSLRKPLSSKPYKNKEDVETESSGERAAKRFERKPYSKTSSKATPDQRASAASKSTTSKSTSRSDSRSATSKAPSKSVSKSASSRAKSTAKPQTKSTAKSPTKSQPKGPAKSPHKKSVRK